jgi:hypothetical protein|uniref:Uncharacterized protein n=1 Tax=Oryza sativa subsp. japonica TaxID=39947 RepID=Q6Z9W2_ORYSJ|nr:hypothetical protein [Oryza sativa Japonica Group]
MDERMAPVWLDNVFHGTVWCVEYVADDRSVLLLTVTKGEKKGVAEVDVVDYEVWVLGCVGHYLDPESNTVE